MLDDRRLSTHIYNEEQAQSIFGVIRKEYFPMLKELQQTLEEMRSENQGHLFY